MKVTEIRLNLMESDRVVKAVGSILLDDVFAVRGIRVMEDKNENLLMAFLSFSICVVLIMLLMFMLMELLSLLLLSSVERSFLSWLI